MASVKPIGREALLTALKSGGEIHYNVLTARVRLRPAEGPELSVRWALFIALIREQVIAPQAGHAIVEVWRLK